MILIYINYLMLSDGFQFLTSLPPLLVPHPIPAPRSQLFRSGQDRLAEADALLLLSQASWGPRAT